MGGRCLAEVIFLEFVFKSNFSTSFNVFFPGELQSIDRMSANEKMQGAGDG